MKPGILLVGKGNTQWIGGLYYIKNIAFVLSQNEYICRKYNLFLLTFRENINVFQGLSDFVQMITIPQSFCEIEKLYRILLCKIMNIKYMFPCSTKISSFFQIRGISWIPDFQHNRLPHCYTESEREHRIEASRKIVRIGYPLVLSSEDCRNDLKLFYGRERSVFVVPFVSYIEPQIIEDIISEEDEILKKYHLFDRKYIYIANQFWQHKNHIVVLEAAKLLLEKVENQDMFFVFTGRMKDSRTPHYIDKISSYFEDIAMGGHLLNCGFIDRKEQLAIMKNSQFVVQPSLFEGWGTVVEDAKVLDKTILLSDIPIHREQKNEKCILFDPYNPKQLAGLIEKEIKCEHCDSIEDGVQDMYERAKKYSENFKKMLDCY
ncbi:glycosyltransferase [Acetatifactor aquisgranensis]|uniref:glycosyltransferase n=1 Tax=Acetatifactor aquisgranensis TaxID=2941233 RepID=UPI00203FCEE0|nr:glycosyltransferase [Acetatifactor aquisgranensis]